MGYKYFIKSHENKYYFGLYPNNNNRQPLAISGDYLSIEDAKDGMEKLKRLLRESSRKFVLRKEKNGYYFDLADEKWQLTFTRSKALHHRYEVARCINRINQNFESPLKYNIEKDI